MPRTGRPDRRETIVRIQMTGACAVTQFAHRVPDCRWRGRLRV